jgi:hypothetical protein
MTWDRLARAEYAGRRSMFKTSAAMGSVGSPFTSPISIPHGPALMEPSLGSNRRNFPYKRVRAVRPCPRRRRHATVARP